MLDEILNKTKNENTDKSYQTNFNEGIGYIEKKEFEPAIESFKRCLNVDPEDSKSFVGLCIAYSGLMDLDSAREYYEELKEIDPYLAEQLANTQVGSLLEETNDEL